MSQTVQAIYEDGVLKPLEKLTLGEHQRVWVIIELPVTVGIPQSQNADDPLSSVRAAAGFPDLAEHFADFGRHEK